MTIGNSPLVSVICVSYNHSRFVGDAIQSVLNLNYPNVELIVVDDGSIDNSVDVIRSMKVNLIELKKNRGYCAAFNEGFRASKGEFIIDLAADDVLDGERINHGLAQFSNLDETYGVQFGDAFYTDESSIITHSHSDRFPNPPQGDIYIDVIKKYFICAASMMIRRIVLTQLNGYDETLAYEDFDFWIRSSRHFKYIYSNQHMVKKRIVRGSMSEKQFKRGSPQQLSTYKVCEKILALNQTQEENEALGDRIWYEIRQSLRRMDFSLTGKYIRLLNKVSRPSYTKSA